MAVKRVAPKKIVAKRPKAPVTAAAQQLDLKDKQRYVKGYLQVVQNLYKRGAFTREQARLADLAYQKRMPPSGYVALIRKQDPQYVKTQDFRRRQEDARLVWNSVRPGRPMPQDFSARYVHSTLKKEQLIEKVQRGVAAQQGSAFKVSQNRQAYAQMRAMMNNSFRKQTGQDAPPLLHDMVFSAKLRDQHVDDRYHELFGGKEVFGWMDPAQSQQKLERSFRTAVTPPSPTRRLTSAPSIFLDHMQNQFGIGVEDMTGALVSSETK